MTRQDDFFSANASRYDDARPALLSKTACEALAHATGLTPQARILDIATGTGRVAIPFAQAGYRVVGIDRAEEMLHVLRSKAPDARVISIVATGQCLPFATARFDAVVIARLLYLVSDWRSIVADALRVLRPDGHLLHEWADGGPDEPSVQIREHLRTLLENAGIEEPFHPGVRRESDVDAFLRQCGLGVTSEFNAPLESAMTLGDFLDRTARGDFSYTWKAPPAVQEACLGKLRHWAMDRFDLNSAALPREAFWKIYRRLPANGAGRRATPC